MASAFPKLPGFVPTHDPTTLENHKKISHIKLEEIRNGKNVQVPLYALPRQPTPLNGGTAAFNKSVRGNTGMKPEENKSYSQNVFKNHFDTQGKDIAEQFEPTFVKLDKQVLRFNGYFKESVVDSRLENYRIRTIVLFFFLEDHSIMISEPREENSGIPQGKFLKRRQVLREDGSGLAIMPFDLKIGQDVTILGKHFRLVDCDEFTRDFYKLHKQPQGAAQSIPVDAYAETKIEKPKFRDTELKEFMERSLGGGRVSSEKQFLDNDRHVLRFYTRWDSLPFIVHYYLADDTCEIREVHHPNDGRDSFALLLKRRRLPYSFSVGQPGHAQIGDNYLTCDQIHPGGVIEAYGRQFLITGVDQFTRDYFKSKFGRIFDLGEIEYPKPSEPTQRQIPPHNGFGDEIDSLGYVYKLLPEKPKRDFFKYVDNDKTVLRFTARFNTRVPEDIDRRFIVSFFLADDSISIFEPAQKNSGIIEGKFLERGKYKNVDKNGAFVTPTDMPIGGTVKINGYSFLIESSDEFTQKWLDAHLV